MRKQVEIRCGFVQVTAPTENAFMSEKNYKHKNLKKLYSGNIRRGEIRQFLFLCNGYVFHLGTLWVLDKRTQLKVYPAQIVLQVLTQKQP